VHRWIPALALGALCGCSSSSTTSISLSIPNSATIDTRCDDPGSSCGATGYVDGVENLTVFVNYGIPSTSDTASSNVATLKQYRVDYSLFGGSSNSTDTATADGFPYYSNLLTTTVSMGQQQELSLIVAGSAQRNFVWNREGYTSADGTGTLTIAGYDSGNNAFQVSGSFPIKFTDVRTQ
jgi:hypothetical protein